MEGEASPFDRLAREMDSAERRALLVRIQGLVPEFTGSLCPDAEGEVAFTPGQEIERLGFLRRLLLALWAAVSHRDRVALLRRRSLRRLAARLTRTHPGLADFRSERFGEPLGRALADLQAHARVLRGVFAEPLLSHRQQFAAFLARQGLADFQARLESATDPQALDAEAAELGLQEDRHVRAAMLRRFDESFAALPEAHTRGLRADAAAVEALRALAHHGFDALLAPFAAAAGTAEGGCPFAVLRAPLHELAGLLAGLRAPPSPQAVYDLFLFGCGERLEDRDFDLRARLLADLPPFQAALAGIREFHERVPLTGLLRCLDADPAYVARASGTGDPWPALYREYWHGRLQRRFLEFQHARLAERLRAAARAFFGGRELPELVSYRDERFGPGTPVQHGLAAAFLKGIADYTLPPLLRPLKLIYLNGEFYKQENRQAFTDGFLFLSRLEAAVERIDSRLGPQGDLRALVQSLRSEPLAAPAMRQRIRGVLARADSEVRALVDQALERLESLELLLNGILHGQPGERYDSLANLQRIGGRENRSLRDAWSAAIGQAAEARRLLREILDLEIRRP